MTVPFYDDDRDDEHLDAYRDEPPPTRFELAEWAAEEERERLHELGLDDD